MAIRPRMEPENVINERIAEPLIEELLRSSGNNIYRFGYESIFQNLGQTDSWFDRKTRNGQKVRSIPDFVVANLEEKSLFLEVKFPPEENT